MYTMLVYASAAHKDAGVFKWLFMVGMGMCGLLRQVQWTPNRIQIKKKGCYENETAIEQNNISLKIISPSSSPGVYV